MHGFYVVLHLLVFQLRRALRAGLVLQMQGIPAAEVVVVGMPLGLPDLAQLLAQALNQELVALYSTCPMANLSACWMLQSGPHYLCCWLAVLHMGLSLQWGKFSPRPRKCWPLALGSP